MISPLEQGGQMRPDSPPRRLAAILSADVAGYSRLMAQDDVATLRALTFFRDQIGRHVSRHEGRVVDAPGDNLLAELPSALEATRCALEIQRVLAIHNSALAPEHRMEFRIAVHLGDVLEEDGGLYGDAVNIAARLQGIAAPGAVVVSDAVHTQVVGKLEAVFSDRGAQRLKNLPFPVRAFELGPQQSSIVTAYPGGEAVATPALAVLPFVNVGGDPDQEYLADGLTEDLITDLARQPGLQVIARTSVFAYKGRPERAQEIGRDLRVRYIVEGSIRRVERRVRITAQLIDAATSHHLWAERYDREIEGILEVQGEVSGEIARVLSVRLGTIELPRAEMRPKDPRAFDEYLRALALFRRFSLEEVRRARTHLERVIELEPGFAVAYSLLAGCHLHEWQEATRDPAERDHALELVDRAAALDPSSPEVLAHQSVVRWNTGNAPTSVEPARRAVELKPGYAFAHGALAAALSVTGQGSEAILHAERALRLDPFEPLVQITAGIAYYVEQRYDEAIACLERVLVYMPDWVVPHIWLSGAYAEAGHLDHARHALDEMRRLAPGVPLVAVKQMGVEILGSLSERHWSALERAGLA
jgi:adenylate cyclase